MRSSGSASYFALGSGINIGAGRAKGLARKFE